MENIANHLTALRFMYHQTHLLSKKYQRHLIYDRLIEPLDSLTDRIKEIALGSMQSESIANAFNSLSNAAILAQSYSPVDYESIKKFIYSIIKIVNNYSASLEIKASEDSDAIVESDFNVGLQNVLGDVSEMLIQHIYLLNTNIEG